MYKHLGLFVLSVALFTLARNMGDYKNTPLAEAVAVVAGGFGLIAVALVIRDLVERRKNSRAPEPEALPTPIHTITFEYLPTSPLESGQWKKAYGKQEAIFERDSDIPGGLKMRQQMASYAMDYRLPQYATLANHIEFTAKYISDAAVYAEVEVRGEDGLHPDVFWFAHLIGNKPPEYLEQYHEWQFHLSPRDDRFLVDLREEVRLSLGRNGLIFVGVKQIKVRGNISISPLKLRRLG
jgi:hypothetical protein